MTAYVVSVEEDVAAVFSTREAAETYQSRWEAHYEAGPECPELTDGDRAWIAFSEAQDAWLALWPDFPLGEYCNVREYVVDAEAGHSQT